MVNVQVLQATTIRALYRKNHPASKAQGASQVAKLGEGLALQFMDDFAGLKRLVPPLSMSLVGLPRDEKAKRGVKVPSGSAAKDICSLAAAIAASDACFGRMDEASLKRCTKLGEVLREARLTGLPLQELGAADMDLIKDAIVSAQGWEEETQEWVVDKILAHKVEGKDELFMVRWEAGDTTWESLQNLEDTAMEKVTEYRARQANKASGGRSKGRPVSREDLDQVLQGLDEEDSPEDQAALLTGGAGIVEGRSAGSMDVGLKALVGAMQALADETLVMKKSLKVAAGGATKARKRSREDSSDDSEEDEDLRLARDKPVLQGDKRMEEVGWEHFQQERELYTKFNQRKLPAHAHFAKEYNEQLRLLYETEEQMLEQKLKVKKSYTKAAAQPDNASLEEEYRQTKATYSVYATRWAVLNDMVLCLGECSQAASEGKKTVAAKVYERALRTSKETEARKSWRKLFKDAEKELRDERDLDKGLFISQQLGHLSSTPQVGGGFGGRPSGYTTEPVGLDKPPPPPSRPLPVGQQLAIMDSGRERGAGVAKRVQFRPAEEVLKRVPGALQGCMLPVGMKFFTPGKMLDSSPKVREKEFVHACKVCGMMPPQVKGHEAWECTERFKVDGKTGKGYRELFSVHQVCDNHGEYK